MIGFNSIVFLFITSATFFLDYASSLHVEGIRNGEHVSTGEYTYQAGILIPDTEFHYPFKLIGSGSFISKDLVLTAAQLFVHDDGTFIENTYSVVCCTKNWFHSRGTVVLIYNIYFPGGGSYHFLNNIAVAKLRESLIVEGNPQLSKVSIPSSIRRHYATKANVSGYGYHYIEMDWDKTGKIVRVDESGRANLLYANVMVGQEDCKIGDRPIHHERHLCGQTEEAWIGEESGVCNDDAGSPLVSNNEVLGVALLYHIDCDDTDGNGYMNVAYFAEFINSIINETPLANTLVRFNLIPTAGSAA